MVVREWAPRGSESRQELKGDRASRPTLENRRGDVGAKEVVPPTHAGARTANQSAGILGETRMQPVSAALPIVIAVETHTALAPTPVEVGKKGGNWLEKVGDWIGDLLGLVPEQEPILAEAVVVTVLDTNGERCRWDDRW